ncbi:phospholipase D-like domain-containing protein [Roseicella aerolata]|uniref:Phospholipase D n=1 Tax=Roseicella aerolata TaxID=2883479 RepID=A0A9X1LAQ0_9PROT|nr:phospholipase D-like domain-containing protein [Roseicella aerolata]MCB4821647.1 phospholipase D-like domain-containing protein [Roseicella aerolata]
MRHAAARAARRAGSPWRRRLRDAAFLLAGALASLLVLNLLPAQRGLGALLDHGHGAGDPAFLRDMDGALGPSIRPGNRVETLVNGDRIFPAMLAAIAASERSINFETYVYWDGESARRFAEALAERARAGVEVRVLLDWFGSLPTERALLQLMRDAGADVRRFRRPRWYTLDRLNNRTHRKLLVVDGRVGFTGGVGIGDKWLGDARDETEWRETQYRVEGPVVAQMQAAFLENWLEVASELPRGPAQFPALAEAGPLPAQMVRSSPQGGATTMHLMLMMAIAAAERHIRIGVPYFVPDELAIRHLVEARRRGVTVDVLLPGPHMDKPFVRRASRHLWGPLLEAGVRIWEYQPSMYHPKLVLVDEAFASVGSTNFDERSFRLNDEANLNVFDADFARGQIALFDADLARAREVTLAAWRDRPGGQRLGDRVWALLRPQL